jgi:hypothetical protein
VADEWADQRGSLLRVSKGLPAETIFGIIADLPVGVGIFPPPSRLVQMLFARVVKLVDAGDSKSPAARRAGSIPAPGTIKIFR